MLKEGSRARNFVIPAVMGILMCVFALSDFRPLEAGELESENKWEQPPEVAFSTDVYSMYVWRGGREVNGGVIQPAALVSYAGFYAEYWGNMDLTHTEGSSGDLTEINLALGYEVEFLDMGLLYYAFPNSGAEPTTEFYFGIELPLFLSPALTIYQDIDDVWGNYASLGIGHTFEDVMELGATAAVSVDLGASVGHGDSKHNEEIYGTDSDAFTDAMYSIAFPVTLPNRLEISPSASYTSVLDSRLRRKMDNKDNLFAGLSLSYSF